MIETNRKKILEELGLQEAVVVSYDIPSSDNNRRATIHRLLYGRDDTKEVNGRMKTYRYPGLLDKGGLRMGQSVFLLPPDLASILGAKLGELKISHQLWTVWTGSLNEHRIQSLTF